MGIRESVKSRTMTKDEAIALAKSWLKNEPFNSVRINRLINWIKNR